jgi:prevent-host-death family protein
LVQDFIHAEAAVTQINVHEAKTHFAKLLQRVALGEEVVITRAGRPIAKLVQIQPDVLERAPGSARGEVRVGEDFDAPLPEDGQASFE